MPITIVCDGCGKGLVPLLWRRGNDAGISARGRGVTFACTADGKIIVACSDHCREFISMGQQETFAC
jgi:hypothetical protein